MPPHPISTLTTLVIPLFFVLGVVNAPPGTAVPLSTSGVTTPTDTSWSPDGTGPGRAVGASFAGGSLGFAGRPGAAAVVDDRAEPSVAAAQRTATRSSGATALDGKPSPADAPSAASVFDAVGSPRNDGAHGPVEADGGTASYGAGAVGRECSGSACELRRPTPRTVDEGFGGNLPTGPAGAPLPAWCASLGQITLNPAPAPDCAAGGADPFERTPLDREYCEYVGPAPFFMSPSDSEFCGFVSPAPLSSPSVGAGRPAK